MSLQRKDKAILAANELIYLMDKFSALRKETEEFLNKYDSRAYNTTWGNFPTAIENGDGTLGAEDGTPNTAHPIDIRIVTELSSVCSQAQLVAGVSFFTDYQKFLNNKDVSKAQRSQSIDDLAN